jgi:hypothetical protein
MIATFIHFVTAFVFLTFSLLIFNQVFLRKMKSKILTSDNDYKLSYLILYCGIFLGLALLYHQLSGSIEYAIFSFSKNDTYTFFTLFKNLCVILVIGFSWFFLIYLLRFIVVNLLILDANDIKEMENNNYLFFLLSGVVFIALLLLFSSTLHSLTDVLTDKVSNRLFN